MLCFSSSTSTNISAIPEILQSIELHSDPCVAHMMTSHPLSIAKRFCRLHGFQLHLTSISPHLVLVPFKGSHYKNRLLLLLLCKMQYNGIYTRMSGDSGQMNQSQLQPVIIGQEDCHPYVSVPRSSPY